MHVPSIAVFLVLRVQSGREEQVWKEQWWNVEERQSRWQGLGESKDGLSHVGSVLQWRCMGMPPISQSSQQDSSVRKGASWVIWSPQNHVWGKERPKFPPHTWPHNNKHYIYGQGLNGNL